MFAVEKVTPYCRAMRPEVSARLRGLSRVSQCFGAALALSALCITLSCATAAPRPNTFLLQSFQAGSTTDIDDIKVVDLDSRKTVYSNSFASPDAATNSLRLVHWPVGGSDDASFVLDSRNTRVFNGRLRLETTGFNANGSGGYESRSEAEFLGTLPHNFLVEFKARRMQWPGHFHFLVYYRDPSDAPVSHQAGGSFSRNRPSDLPLDVYRMAASGDWFQQSGVMTNFGKASQPWAVTFPAPSGSLMRARRLGMALSNSVLSFYLDGKVVGSTNVSHLITPAGSESSSKPED